MSKIRNFINIYFPIRIVKIINFSLPPIYLKSMILFFAILYLLFNAFLAEMDFTMINKNLQLFVTLQAEKKVTGITQTRSIKHE